MTYFAHISVYRKKEKKKKGKGCWGYIWAPCFVTFFSSCVMSFPLADFEGLGKPSVVFSSSSGVFVQYFVAFHWIHSSFRQWLHHWLQQRPTAWSKPSPCLTVGDVLFLWKSSSIFFFQTYLCSLGQMVFSHEGHACTGFTALLLKSLINLPEGLLQSKFSLSFTPQPPLFLKCVRLQKRLPENALLSPPCVGISCFNL